MNEPSWRGAEELIDYRREFIRREMVDGQNGFIAEDVDLVLRVYGEKFDSDYLGKFRLVELKSHEGTFNSSQQKTLGLMDRMLRQSPESHRYGGFFLVYSKTEKWKIKKGPHDFESWDEYENYKQLRNEERIIVNGWELTYEQFNKWLEWELEISPVSPFNGVPFYASKWNKGPFVEGSNLES